MNVLNQLVLSPFEWTMSDRISASPMEFVVRLDCVGDVDAAKLADAILVELKRQPLLQANATVGETHRESFWRPASNCTPKIQWCDGNPDQGRGVPDDFTPIDLENEIGIRFYGWRFLANDQTRIVMKFVYHHSCCDGKGGLAFADNVLHRYQLSMGETASPLGDVAVVDPQQVNRRNLPAASKSGILKRFWRTFVVRPKRAAKMLLSKPHIFRDDTRVPSASNEDIFSDPPRLCSTKLSVPETEQLGELAKKLSATSNTILARELFHSVNDWLTVDSGHKRRNLRILIPYSLRDERHEQMPAANCVSMVYLEASEKMLEADSSDASVLLSEIVRQVDFIRRWNLQYSWIESIAFHGKIWPILKLFKFRKQGSQNMAPITTTVMTNVGRAFSGSKLRNNDGEIAVDSLVVKSIYVLPPCSATVPFICSVNFYGNRLTLAVNYLPFLLRQETAEGILHSWKKRILASVAAVSDDA